MKLSYLLFTVAFAIAISCNNESSEINPPKTDVLVFKDADDFHQTFVLLSKMSSKDEMAQWALGKNHSTLLDSEDEGVVNHPNAFKTILNKDAEFQIGEDIIWYNKGTLYSFSKSQISNRDALKKDEKELIKYGSAGGAAKSNDDDQPNGRLSGAPDNTLDFNSRIAQNQIPFTIASAQPCGSSWYSTNGNRKYVHEMFDYTIQVGSSRHSYIYLVIKLEWKGSGSWKDAGEQRYTHVNVSGTVQVKGSGLLPYPFAINQTNDCYTGHWEIYIIDAFHGPGYSGPDPCWIVIMDGEIYHYVKGDAASNAWSNTQCPDCNPGTTRLW